MRLQEIRGKRVSILGAGISGRAAAAALSQQDNRILVSDRAWPPPRIQAYLQNLGVTLELGGHTARTLQAEVLVVSPGIAPHRFPVHQALTRGLPVTTELDLGWDRLLGPVLAVTGTNGKTTVATLLHQMVPGSVLAGNVGNPLLLVPEQKRHLPVVAEVSSFQLFYGRRFHPRVAVLLNLAPDHLDWHGSAEAYFQAKLDLLHRLGPDDLAVLNADDPRIREVAQHLEARVAYFSVHQKVPGGFVDGNHLVLQMPHRPRTTLRLPDHPAAQWYLEDLLAAALAAYGFHGDPTPLQRALDRFRGLPHRLEPVARKGGVWFVNDSKATNPHATAFALRRVAGLGPVALILGGQDKGLNLADLLAALPPQLAGIVAIGEASEGILKIFGPHHRVQRATTLEEAVRLAYQWVKPRGVVLLSPACASFDMFANYRERGERFKYAVQHLTS